MLNKENKKYAKIITKAIKNINKQYTKNIKYAGRFEIIDCFYQAEKTKYEGLLKVYYFEWKDKQSQKSKFFQVSVADFISCFSLEEFEKKLKEIVSHFEVFYSEFWSNTNK